MTGIVALFLAGLGLFFHGLAGLKSSIQGFASRRVRVLLGKWSKQPLLAGLWGFCFGALTQSVTAVAFILASLVEGGVISASRALPIVAAANLGTALLVLVASVDINLAILYCLGLASISLAFGLGGGRLKPVFSSLFFAALLFFGLRAMKDAFAPLPAYPWFTDFARVLQGSVLAAFCVGAMLRLFIQSSPAIAVIAIALSHGGLLSGDQVMAMMFGTGVGVGGAVLLLSSNLRGVPKQIALYQGLLSSCASLSLGVLFAVERFSGWPLICHGLAALPGTEKLHLAYAFVAMQGLSVLYALASVPFASRLLARLSPPTPEQDLSRTEHLSEEAFSDPESALALAQLELRRLLDRVPKMLDAARPEIAQGSQVSARIYLRANEKIAEELRSYLRRLSELNLDSSGSDTLLLTERRLSLTISLSECAADLSGALETLGANTALKSYACSLAEGGHALAEMLCEDAASGTSETVSMLLAMTADRGEAMERFRHRALQAASDLAHEQKAHLLYTISLYERLVWLLRQWTLTVRA